MSVRPATLDPMQKPLIEPWTDDDVLAWERAQEERYEFVDGIVRMMVGGTLAHARIKGNVYASLREQLGGSRCEVFFDGPKVVTAGASMYPDAVVTCAPDLAPDADAVPEPVLILEVLSRCPPRGPGRRPSQPASVAGPAGGSIETRCRNSSLPRDAAPARQLGDDLESAAPLQQALERGQGLLADVVLDSLGVDPRPLLAHADRLEKVLHQLMPPPGMLRELSACIREEHRPIGAARDQALALQPTERLADRRMRHAQPLGDLDRARFAFGIDQLRDQLDVVLGDLQAVGLPGLPEACGLLFGARGVAALSVAAGRAALIRHPGRLCDMSACAAT